MAEAASGIDFNELCKQRVCEPLGMTDSGFRLADIGTTNLAMPYRTMSNDDLSPIFHYGYPDYPDGALRTSAAHLARWLGAFTNLGTFEGARVLDETTVREIRRNQIPDLVAWHQGLIWYGERPLGFFTMGHTAEATTERVRGCSSAPTSVWGSSRSRTRTWAAVGGPRSSTSSAVCFENFPDRPCH